MTYRLLCLAALAAVTLGASAPQSAPQSVPAPLAAHQTRIPYTEIFRRSVSDVSGDIFLLTQPNDYLLDEVEFDARRWHSSHISTKHDGKVDVVVPPHGISTHGFAWDYDLRIPLAFYDPTGKWFKPGRYADVAVQQDIAPTLADVLGIPAPDRSEGRILKGARVANPKAGRPKVVAVLVQDQMGLQYFAAHPQRLKFIRKLLARSASFDNAQVAHVDVETSVGHAAIGTGAYARGHGVTSNTRWNTGLWVAKPVYSAQLTETLASDAYPLQLSAATLADVWSEANGGRPAVLSLVAAPRASLSLGGHGSMFKGGKKTSVLYLREHGPDAGTYGSDETFYTVPASVKGKSVRPYAEAFQKEKGGAWWGTKLIGDDGKLDLGLVESSPALVRFESDLVDASLDELKIGQRGETDLVFLNFKSSDYCGHMFGYESEECGEVLDAVDHAVERVVTKLEKTTGGELVVAYTADHGAAPIPELSGGLRYSREKLLTDLQQHFDHIDNHVDAVAFLSSSQVWVNRRELALNGFTVQDVVTFLKDYEVPMAAPWNVEAAAWLAKGKPRAHKLFYDVVARDELARAAPPALRD